MNTNFIRVLSFSGVPLVGLAGLIGLTLNPSAAFAQLNLTPDRTTATTVESIDTTGERITGGDRSQNGANLFHSFSEFNVREGRSVRFAVPSGVQNILSRVTGSDPSDILGTLGTDGVANLFLLNPNGIIFGPNARLEVSGSFLATTADRFVFDNGQVFSAVNPQAAPLLTISTPIGLQYDGNGRGAITINGSQLTTGKERDILLAGGDIRLENRANLRLFGFVGGRIELVGINGAGLLGLNSTANSFSFSLPSGIARSDVSIRDGSMIGAIDADRGNIAIYANNVTLQGSKLEAGLYPEQGITNGQAGDIVIDRVSASKFVTSDTDNLSQM